MPPKPPHSPSDNESKKYIRFKKSTAYQKGYHQTMADWFQATPGLDDQRNVKDIRSVLAGILGKFQVEESTYPEEELQEAWLNSVGQFIAQTTQLESIVNDTATVRVLHPTIRFQLQQNERSILTKLRLALKDNSIKKIRFNLN